MSRRSTSPVAPRGWVQRLKAYVGELRALTAVYDTPTTTPAPAAPAKAKAPRRAAVAVEGALPITAALRKQMKADVAQRLPEGQQPSAAQWKMIFSPAPATCVVAGAGAGKSASLVLRVVLLVHYLGVPLEQLSVVTFTRESRKDFITRLVATLALWERRLSERQAREVVRTFHAQVLGWAQALPGQADLKAFETLGQAGAGDPDEPPFAHTLNNAQRALCLAAFEQLLARDALFASSIDALRQRHLQLPTLSSDHPEVRKRATVMALAAARDEALCQSIEALWRAAKAWPLEGIDAGLRPLAVRGAGFFSHGWHSGLQAHVVLGVDPREREQRRAQGELPLAAEAAVKRTLLQAFCDQPVLWLDSYQQARQLGNTLAASQGPGFDYRLLGEHSPLPLLDAFYQAGSFIETLGLAVPRAILDAGLAQDGDDALFFQALALYWPALQAHLAAQQPPMPSYNRLFSQFCEASALRAVPDALLQRMAHLLVDEFQDVSPLLVNWLNALRAEQQRRGLASGSLMCVGDDWQSIYGWRGSSPQFFLKFEQVFSAPSHARLMLRDNYRSQQGVIDAAEHLVKGTRSLKGKKGRAVGERAVQPVQVRSASDSAVLEVVQQHLAQGHSVLVLYRKGSDRPGLAALLKPALAQAKAGELSLRLLTCHAAKGLEADALVFVGECQYSGSSPWRNALYRLAGLAEDGEPAPYDQAQREEALRLAYVTLTRARQHAYWFVPAQGGAGEKASAQVAGQPTLFDDQR